MTTQQISEKTRTKSEAKLSDLGQASAKALRLDRSRGNTSGFAIASLPAHMQRAKSVTSTLPGKRCISDKSDLDEYLRRNRVRPSWKSEGGAGEHRGGHDRPIRTSKISGHLTAWDRAGYGTEANVLIHGGEQSSGALVR